MTPTLLEFAKKSDERILCDIMRQMNWQSDIDASNIRVEVRKGVITLRGAVETCVEKIEAENAVKAVYGATAIINHLEVSPSHVPTDSEIVNDIIAALHNTTSILDRMPQVTVRDGIAIFHGSCRWDFQRLCAERTALSTKGVKAVVNLITVDPAPSPLPHTDVGGPTLVRQAS
ncbi:BON domain-containing protein [Edaphobacter flagellatus]|uniref:BON domain-containing protein n=1 Tax=Edaphobacter flagellatus TaxID=1933044 RepID=UPI0021B26985|nr:BON domain-containing protein [Edaphobacter flagellatus]